MTGYRVESGILDSFVTKMRPATPILSVQAAMEVPKSDGKLFMVNATYKNHFDISYSDLVNMFGDATNNKLSVVAGSVDVLGDNRDNRVVSFLARANQEIKNPAENVMAKMVVVTSNVFRDKEDDTIWNMIGEGPDRRLVRASREDFGALLDARKQATNTVVASTQEVPFNHGTVVYPHDFIMFYDVAAGAYDYGFGLSVASNQVDVVGLNNRKIRAISPLQVVASVPMMDQGEEILPVSLRRYMERAAANGSLTPFTESVVEPTEGDFSEPMANAYLTYMKSLFDGTDYFRNLGQLVGERRNIAKRDTPLTTMRVEHPHE